MKEFDSSPNLEISYRADISYIGTQFNGFQCQPDKKSVQDELKRGFSIFFGRPIRINGASRTDSGVHAYNQVITFKTDKKYDEDRWLRGLNSLISPQIGIQSIKEISQDFHPITSATAKIYRYKLCLGFCYDPFLRPFVWEVKKSLNIDLMKKNLNGLIGYHDFKSFCATDGNAKTSCREIMQIELIQNGNYIDLWIVGTGFLKQMVRIIVGTLVDMSIGKLNLDMAEILQSCDRNKAGLTAPAQGLCLMKIFYEQRDEIFSEYERLKNEINR